DRAFQLARKAVQLDPNLPQAHIALAMVQSRKNLHDLAVAELEKAISLNPNFSDYQFIPTLVHAGAPLRAIQIAQTHMRVDPFYSPLAVQWLGAAHYAL